MKLCECGCGKPTNIITKTRTDRGEFIGEYRKYIKFHKVRQPLKNRSFFNNYWSAMNRSDRKEFINSIISDQGINKFAIYNRIYKGWTKEQILNGTRKSNAYTERKLFINKIMIDQDVTMATVKQRFRMGWTIEQITRGWRVKFKYKLTKYVKGLRPYDQGETVDAFPNSNIVDNAEIRFMFLLFDTVKSITKLNDVECYPITCQIFKGLHDRYDIKRNA